MDRGRLRATLYRSGRRIWRSPIGVGKVGTPTPAGDFWIREKFRVANPGGPFGPQAFGPSNYSRLRDWPGGGVIGILAEAGMRGGRRTSACPVCKAADQLLRRPRSGALRLGVLGACRRSGAAR
ncbi:MAG: L,D-transpeptidase [Solirubrobacterales bacterium]